MIIKKASLEVEVSVDGANDKEVGHYEKLVVSEGGHEGIREDDYHFHNLSNI